jgi:hypothetical protein
MFRALALTAALAGSNVAAAQDQQNFVALIIGLSSYQNLPDEVELDFARSDAALVHKELRESGNFTDVFLLADGEATKNEIRDLLRNTIAQIVGPNDVFVVYFAGHGIGADLGLPVLLAHDSTLQNGQEDGLELEAFARDLQTWTRAKTMLVVTDAIHRNQLDGIYFYGPSAEQWPSFPKGTMVLSSSGKETAATDGAFGKVFAEGITGNADANGDKVITAGELYTYIQATLAPEGQSPEAAGDYSPDMVLARDVKGAPVEVENYPDTEIWSAKFVFREGDAQTVQCRDREVTACAPSCYVRNFLSGPCELSAVVDGINMGGRVIVLWPGKYDCGRKGGDLMCSPPKTEVIERPW